MDISANKKEDTFMINIPSEFYGKYVKRIKTIKLFILIFILFAIGILAFIYLKGLFKMAFIPYIILVWWGYSVINKIVSEKLFSEMMTIMSLANNWVNDENFEDKSWKFMEDLELFQLLNSSFINVSEEFLLRGKFCDRDFSFYLLEATYGKNSTESFFLIKTTPTPIYNFDEYILIKHKDEALEEDEIECEDLQITDTDMKGLYTVYSTKPQENSKVLSPAFINALADYATTTGEKISLLLTPKGILISKNFGPVKKPSLCFSSAENYVSAYWQSTETFLKLLEAINLLEK